MTLSLEDSLKYESIKTAILKGLRTRSRGVSARFRGYRKNSSQTFIEFTREKCIMFDKWHNASKAHDFDSLKELILLEEFKRMFA